MYRPSGIAIVAALLLSSGVWAAPPIAPPPTRAQVEADWLHQDVKRSLPPADGLTTTPVQDAAGGVDGVKTGRWGFHTTLERNPWWQVDLEQPRKIDRLVLYNRCDGTAGRNARIAVLVSDDGRSFRQVYRHDGSVFHGVTGGPPLTVRLDGVTARFVRLALTGESYFHLDEVEVYPAGSDRNIALGKPATQSSTSAWSVVHTKTDAAPTRAYPIATVIDRGLRLAASQRRLGAKVDAEVATLEAVGAALRQLPAGTADTARRALYFRAHHAVRRLALANPLLNCAAVLFVERAPGAFPHMSDQHYGWWSRPGGGVFVLEGFRAEQPRVHCLTADMPEGSFIGPDLSYDGRKVLFAYCRYDPKVADMDKLDKDKLPADTFYHVFEMNVDGTGRRQVTHGRYDDFDPRYLPSGDIVFLSTRKGLALQCSETFSDSTRLADLPDSYVRCGGDSFRPVPVFTLHAMRPDGTHIRPLSSFENFEWTPSVASDGRILYTRWDYIDRFNGNFFSLWTSNQDGTNPQLVYGNYTMKPQVKCEARSVPGSSKLVITAGAHHSITGGALCLLDRSKGTEYDEPLTRLTPEVVFPETGGQPEHYYANPWPLSEEYFLVAWSDQRLPPHCRATDEQNPRNAMGLYLYDAFGNQELLYRDPAISSMYPIPIAPRPVPPRQAPQRERSAAEGRFLVQDVYRGLEGVPRGTIKRLRIIGVPPKVQPWMNRPVLGVSAEDPGKFVLGTVPVEPDGSVHFRVPSGVPLLFQAVDRTGVTVQTMRSLTFVMPGQTLSCVGCHEHRDAAPAVTAPALASLREPSRITPGPAGSWPLSFAGLVQPVLDRHCVRCHRPGGEDAAASRLDLTADRSYDMLMSFGGNDLATLAHERDRSVAGQGVAANSKLWSLLTGGSGHQRVTLDADGRDRLATWMDTYAQRLGHYSDEQARALARFRAELTGLFEPAGR
jgi:Hydrazine synthase alpha subunit middle domain/F5/8 type C domain